MGEGIYRVLALRVREERRHAGLTLEQLGERAGITGAFVAHIEAGRKRPTLETIERLAGALGLPVPTLLAADGEGAGGDKRLLERLARYFAPLTPAQRDALLRLVRAGAELAQR